MPANITEGNASIRNFKNGPIMYVSLTTLEIHVMKSIIPEMTIIRIGRMKNIAR